ncbi:hypothetical protein HaLaN_16221, partial [Haematococcus lacustris]
GGTTPCGPRSQSRAGPMPSSGCTVARSAWWQASGPSSSSRPRSGGQTVPWHWPMGQLASAAAGALAAGVS